jgi:hypothetical protein
VHSGGCDSRASPTHLFGKCRRTEAARFVRGVCGCPGATFSSRPAGLLRARPSVPRPALLIAGSSLRLSFSTPASPASAASAAAESDHVPLRDETGRRRQSHACHHFRIRRERACSSHRGTVLAATDRGGRVFRGADAHDLAL